MVAAPSPGPAQLTGGRRRRPRSWKRDNTCEMHGNTWQCVRNTCKDVPTAREHAKIRRRACKCTEADGKYTKTRGSTRQRVQNTGTYVICAKCTQTVWKCVEMHVKHLQTRANDTQTRAHAYEIRRKCTEIREKCTKTRRNTCKCGSSTRK